MSGVHCGSDSLCGVAPSRDTQVSLFLNGAGLPHVIDVCRLHWAPRVMGAGRGFRRLCGCLVRGETPCKLFVREGSVCICVSLTFSSGTLRLDGYCWLARELIAAPALPPCRVLSRCFLVAGARLLGSSG